MKQPEHTTRAAGRAAVAADRTGTAPRRSARRHPRRATKSPSLRLAAASAGQRGFLVIYERPGTTVSVADVYEMAGMAVVG